MKTLKYLAICFVVCCLFVAPQLKAEDVGIGIAIRGEHQGTDIQAVFAEEGDILDYIVTVTVQDTQWSVSEADIFITLPSGDEIQLASGVDLASPSVTTFDPAAVYTISAADLGSLAGVVSNGVRATARVEGISNRPTLPQNVDAALDFDTLVLNPCVTVEKIAACDVTKEGDTYDYTIVISNCGGDDLTAVSIDDTMFGSLLDLGCNVLPAGGQCSVTTPYTVQPGDPDPLVNVVTVVYEVTGIPAITVTDTSNEEVDVIHPDFDLTKVCLTDNVDANEVTFLITIDNTGDVELDFTTDEAEVPPFTLAPGGAAHEVQVTRPVPADATEVENTINVVATLPDEYICGDNGATIEKSASDTCTILQPAFEVTKECITPEVIAGQMATFLITINNTGNTSLDFVTDEVEVTPFTLAAGEEKTQKVDRMAVAGVVENTIVVTATTVTGTTLTGTDTDTCLVITPDFEVVKNCLTDPVVADSNAIFEIIVTNTGDIAMEFEINDAPDAPFVVTIAPDATWEGTVERIPGDCGVDVVVSNTVVVTAIIDGQIFGVKEATAVCPVPCVGEEGCTPGFWKNHPACWCSAYATDMPAADVFTALGDPNYAEYSDKKCDFGTDTLLDALRYGGGRGLAGATRNMLRHATAALLNGCNGNVNYPVSDALVIDLVNAALATEDVDVIQELHGVLAGFNEDNPCPINAHCQVEIDEPEEWVPVTD